MAGVVANVNKQKKPFNLLKWAKSRKGQQAIIIFGFAAIPLLLLLTFTYLPFAEMVRFSFFKMKYSTPVDKRVFVGWENYIDVFQRDDCFRALKLSLYYCAGAIIQLFLALYLATVLSFKVKGGNLFKGLMFFPYLISGIAIGFIFKFLLESTSDLVGIPLDPPMRTQISLVWKQGEHLTNNMNHLIQFVKKYSRNNARALN